MSADDGILPAEKLISGDYWDRTFVFDKLISENPDVYQLVDFTGWTNWRAQWRPDPTSPEIPIDIAVDTSDIANSSITLSLTGVQTAAMGRSGNWDLQSELSGKPKTWISGSFNWVWDVTRD